MRIKDSEGSVGLFYIVDGNAYSFTWTLDECFPDQLGDLQPPENHEFLLGLLKSGSYTLAKGLRENLGYDLDTATVFTFPRGRIWYNINSKTFTVSTSKAVLKSNHCKSQIISDFGLMGKKVNWENNVEYENFDESYL